MNFRKKDLKLGKKEKNKALIILRRFSKQI